MDDFIRGAYRKSRFHDEKGNCVDLGGLVYAVPAFASAAGKRLSKVPMISYRGRRAIDTILTPDSRMVEFGSGNSTIWFAKRAGFVLSIEDDASWYEHVQAVLKRHVVKNVQHELRDEARYPDLSNLEDASLDFALVDGTCRAKCIESVLPKLKTGGWIYLDNSDKDMTRPEGDLRLAEAALLQAVEHRGGKVQTFTGFSPTNFFAEQGMLVRL